MPAGFNKGQVEYIKAIANVNGHKTYKAITYNTEGTSASNDLTQLSADNLLRYRLFCLGKAPYVRTAGGITEGILSNVTALNAFEIPIASANVEDTGNPPNVVQVDKVFAATNEREGPEGFLESTHLRLRLVLPHKTNSFADDHCECRIIVFRARDRQHHQAEHRMDVNNLYYNLFHGIRNYNIGFSGYEQKEGVEGNEYYVAQTNSAFHGQLCVGNQDALTLPINKQAWVVMKDHRFFLGKEYGGKNIYETTLHWDWNDPINTVSSDVTETDNDKNYCWYILIMANNNNFLTEDRPDLSLRIMGTTHMTSG